VQDFSLLYSVQTGTGAHPASYPIGNPGVNRPGCEADHSPPSTAEIKNCGATPPLSHTSYSLVIHQLRTGTTLPFFTFTFIGEMLKKIMTLPRNLSVILAFIMIIVVGR
jgi:hypothetical protein